VRPSLKWKRRFGLVLGLLLLPVLLIFVWFHVKALQSREKARALYEQGVALQKAGHPEQAIISYRKAIASYHDALPFTDQEANPLYPEMAEVYRKLATALEETGREEEGREAFRKALEIEPDLGDRS
jgi:tetratricopeptide (TPR) repeat protein